MIIHYHYNPHKQSICEEVSIALDDIFHNAFDCSGGES